MTEEFGAQHKESEKHVVQTLDRAGFSLTTSRGLPTKEYDPMISNQDSYFAIRGGKFTVAGVFDGVGGKEDGGKASSTCSKAIQQEAEETLRDGKPIKPSFLRELLRTGEKAINTGYTTATIIALEDLGDGSSRLMWESIGDTRVYVYNTETGTLKRLSDDKNSIASLLVDVDDQPLEGLLESLPQSVTDQIEIARKTYKMSWINENTSIINVWEAFNKISTAIGETRSTNWEEFVDSGEYIIRDGDLVFLTSDGFTDSVSRGEFEKSIRESIDSGIPLNELAERLVGNLAYKVSLYSQLSSIPKDRLPSEYQDYQPPKEAKRFKPDDTTLVVVQAGAKNESSTDEPRQAKPDLRNYIPIIEAQPVEAEPETWEITREKWLLMQGSPDEEPRIGPDLSNGWDYSLNPDYHYSSVLKARLDGKEIPPEVLSTYFILALSDEEIAKETDLANRQTYIVDNIAYEKKSLDKGIKYYIEEEGDDVSKAEVRAKEESDYDKKIAHLHKLLDTCKKERQELWNKAWEITKHLRKPQ